ncbi:MAG: YCF48-related protein, partial [Bacteroidota bacterium]|nr:YCF48-related protein [Bacteroidota bacterium]
AFSYGQEVKILNSGKHVSLRGLSAVSNHIIWVSGSLGTVGVSTDGGANWKWMQVPGYEKSDFRDIEAFSDQEAFIMGITLPAVILRTTDRGKHWKTVFSDSTKSAFLDAMDFYDSMGAAIGDPVNGHKYFVETGDRGKSWRHNASVELDSLSKGEAYFASSGSNIKWDNILEWNTISGGKKSRIYNDSGTYDLLINQGSETSGANSIAINPSDPNQAFIVGGDFSIDSSRYRNAIRIQLQPFIQIPPYDPPHGYRSCVEYIDSKRLVCCGPGGVDISADGGMTWKLISNKSFYVCRRVKSGKTVYLAGSGGAIAVLVLNE